jgi:hypothetical protein
LNRQSSIARLLKFTLEESYQTRSFKFQFHGATQVMAGLDFDELHSKSVMRGAEDRGSAHFAPFQRELVFGCLNAYFDATAFDG